MAFPFSPNIAQQPSNSPISREPAAATEESRRPTQPGITGGNPYLFLNPKNKEGEPNFFGRHQKIGRAVEALLFGLAQGGQPSTAADPLGGIKGGVRGLLGYFQALENKPFAEQAQITAQRKEALGLEQIQANIELAAARQKALGSFQFMTPGAGGLVRGDPRTGETTEIVPPKTASPFAGVPSSPGELGYVLENKSKFSPDIVSGAHRTVEIQGEMAAARQILTGGVPRTRSEVIKDGRDYQKQLLDKHTFRQGDLGSMMANKDIYTPEGLARQEEIKTIITKEFQRWLTTFRNGLTNQSFDEHIAPILESFEAQDDKQKLDDLLNPGGAFNN